MALAMTGDTWGISGPTFLVAYLVLTAAVLLATMRARRALADPRPDRPFGDPGAHPHDVAHLHGGPELAVTSALTAMHLKGTVAPVKGQIRAVGRPTSGDDALERAIHFSAGSPVTRRRLALQRPVQSALGGIEKRLVDTGMLLSDTERRQVRATGWWLAGVTGLGLLRLLAGIADGKPVGFLVVALLAVSAVAGVLLAWSPRRSRSGDRLLARLEREHHELAPDTRPDWVAYGPAAAALGIGIFGTSALWASDPAFAEELAMQRTTPGDGGGSGYVGGDASGGDGGGSGCGGGGGGGGGGCGA
ncbi:TIGR04222 domain-containing membrane protein [Pseudonocardia sp.]|uniref:TIGR04222 domain-containing membrane protein n=1 Tax=Pseudonocardia sp. TaxID=60912 RepID=UPI002624841E|nr:TIGR04222 domain-containing membrane protein [Pseudonocardia sp.]